MIQPQIDNHGVVKTRRKRFNHKRGHFKPVCETKRTTVMETESKPNPTSQNNQITCSFTAQKEIFEAKGDFETAAFFARLSSQVGEASSKFGDAFNNWSSRKK